MDKRSEPRFQIRSAINIAAIDHPEQVSEALLLDVSGAGLKIVADNWWPVNTCIVVELENHLVVARVRNIVARGPKFSLGAERLYSVLKHTMPSGVSRTVWHNLLRAEMRDLPATPERATTETVEPLEIAPPEIAGPVVTSSAIAEPEGIARKITLRATEPPEVITTASEERSKAIAPEMPEATARLVETNSHQASLDQASQPEEPPAVSASVTTLRSDESKAAELVVTQRSADDSSGTETSVAETTPEPAAEQLVASPTEEDPTRTTPKVAGAIAETQPVIDSASAPYQKQPSLEALPSAPQPQGLPTLREPVVPIQCESIAPDVPEVTTATPEPDVTPLVAPTPIVSQAQAIDGEGLLLENGSIRTREAVPTVSRTEQSQPLQAAPADAITRRVTTLQAATSQDLSSNVPALASTPASLAPHPIDRRASERPANGQNGTEGQTDPPFGRPFRLSPTAAQSASAVAIPELKPQFGPAYGMAPTAEGLLPISVMPEVAALTPEPKPRSMFSTTVIAGVLGIAALAFYYGPFRPKGSTTPRTQSVQHEAGPLTIPSVADPARASTSASNPLPTSNPVPTTATVPTISPAASVPPTSNLTAPVAVKPEATAQTPVVPAPGVAAKPTPTPASTMAKVIPPVVSAQTVAPAQTATAKIPPPTDPVSSATATPVSPSAGTRRVNITAASLLWFSACSDGKPAFAKVMHTGDTMDIDFHQAIVFKLGNSAAAQLILDGKPLGTLGPPGSVKVVELGAAGLRELPPTSTAGTECQPASAAAKR